MAYPRLKQPTQRLITAIRPSNVNTSVALPSFDSLAGFYVNGGSQSLRRGPAVHHLDGTHRYSIIALWWLQGRVMRVATQFLSVMLVPLGHMKRPEPRVNIGCLSKILLFELYIAIAFGCVGANLIPHFNIPKTFLASCLISLAVCSLVNIRWFSAIVYSRSMYSAVMGIYPVSEMRSPNHHPI